MTKRLPLLLPLLLLSFAAPAQDLDAPLMLVATPELQGPYEHTALVVAPAGGGRHVGFILNRPSNVKLAELFPAHARAAKATEPVRFGGPQMVSAVFAMVRHDPGAPSLHLFGDVYVVGEGGRVDRVVDEEADEARFFVGFVGWDEGELAEEIDSGFWYVAEPEAAQVFGKGAGEAMWGELVRRYGGRRLQVRLRGVAPHRLDDRGVVGVAEPGRRRLLE